MPKKISQEEIEKRRRWIKLFRDILVRNPDLTNSKISGTAKRILELYGYSSPPSLCTFISQYRAPIKEDETRMDHLRVPSSPFVSNALVQALDLLGCWKNEEEAGKKRQQSELLSLIGHQKIPFEISGESVEFLTLGRYDTSSSSKQTKVYAQKIIYNSLRRELDALVARPDMEQRAEILSELENLLCKYQSPPNIIKDGG